MQECEYVSKGKQGGRRKEATLVLAKEVAEHQSSVRYWRRVCVSQQQLYCKYPSS